MSKLYFCFYIPDLNRFVVFNNRNDRNKEYTDSNVIYGLPVKYVPHDTNQEEIFIEEIIEDGDVIDTEEYFMYSVPINQINNIKVHPYNLNLYKRILGYLNE